MKYLPEFLDDDEAYRSKLDATRAVTTFSYPWQRWIVPKVEIQKLQKVTSVLKNAKSATAARAATAWPPKGASRFGDHAYVL